MSNRLTVDTINSDQLDALQLRAARMEHATKQAAELRVRLEDAETGITAAIRQRKEQEDRALRAEKRADQAEELLRIAHDTSNRSEAERARAVQRAEQAEAERDTARQHAAAIAAQRDRLRQRMNNLADRWERDAPPPGNQPLTELRAQISVAPFHGEHTVVQQYRADGTTRWAARCWGTETCDGWLSLDHDTERWAEIARDRHIAEDHSEPAPAEERAARLADLAREILYTGHITTSNISRWRETLDTITDKEQRA